MVLTRPCILPTWPRLFARNLGRDPLDQDTAAMPVRYTSATHMRAMVGLVPAILAMALLADARGLAVFGRAGSLTAAQRPGFGIAPAMAMGGIASLLRDGVCLARRALLV
jgi:hypothetical protein